MSKSGSAVWLLFAPLLILSIGLLAYPMFVIQPFRHQGEVELKSALWMVRWRSYFEAAAVVCAIATLIRYWRKQVRTTPRVIACFAALLVCAAAALTSINIFERMFHPYEKPAFSPAAESKVDAGDKVLAIALRGQSRAYPIRTIAYHHIVNDEVGGVPVVATY